MMRVYASSISEDLVPYRAVVLEVVREMGLEPVVRDPIARRGLSRIEACGCQVATADLLVAIVGWRLGEVPGPEVGGDGARSWTEWEVGLAFDRGLPVTVLMAGDSWPESLRETDAAGRAAVQDFRGELDWLAVHFEAQKAAPGSRSSEAPLGDFKRLVRHRLLATQPGGRHLPHGAPEGRHAALSIEGLRLRRWSAPELPGLPYPLLLPYSHPDLMAGRERELTELRQLLTLPVPILGLHAASGAGKSSLLAAGLVPRLRAEGRAVAFDRHPSEAGLIGRLIRDLVASADENALEIEEDRVATRGPAAFIEMMLAARQLTGNASSRSRASGAPVLILDQFEDLLLRSRARRARALVGSLLAASVQRRPGLNGPTCRWLLAYRQEFHGKVVQWLADVLLEARAEGFTATPRLPHDLSGPERFHGWPLPPLGAPPPGSNDRVGAAARAFQAAIESPLELAGSIYPWRFDKGGAARLARAFGEARIARPGAPLAPELQVVLAHLLEIAGESSDGEPAVVAVPEEPGELIDRALERHLRRSLDAALGDAGSVHRRSRGRRRADPHTAEARIARTRAILALRELADGRGQRGEGLPVSSLARAIDGQDNPAAGERALERLATPRTRLVMLERQAGGWCYVLSHDRLAELLVRLVDEEGAYAGFGVDAKLLALRRFVKLKSELFAAGETVRATEVVASQFKSIERHAAVLLWGEDSERWWRGCRARRQADRRRTTLRRAMATWVVLTLAATVWRWTDRRARRAALFEEVALGEPEAAFAATDRLLTVWQAEPEELRAALRQRAKPLEVLERGIGGIVEGARRKGVILRLADLLLPLVTEDAPEDPVRIASLIWALDFFAPKGEDRTRQLRDLALEPLRRRYPPPLPPEPGDPAWADIPAGALQMSGRPSEGGTGENPTDEGPERPIRLSAFRMGVHEVTTKEFRRLYPEHAEGQEDRLPAVDLTWYQAYTYAAWLGGRLPTVAEAEYAKRAGCAFEFCNRDGGPASLDEVAWWVGNSTDPETGISAPRPVGQLEPNPWGLFDIYGNAFELCSDWYGAYRPGGQVDPPGPTDSDMSYRTGHGGSFLRTPKQVAAPGGGRLSPSFGMRHRGLRVVLVSEDVRRTEGDRQGARHGDLDSRP